MIWEAPESILTVYFFPVRQSILLCNCSCCVALIKTTKIRSQKQFYVTERCS